MKKNPKPTVLVMKPHPLKGAAKEAHERRVLIDRARVRLKDRDERSVWDTETLLRLAVKDTSHNQQKMIGILP